MPNLPPLYPFTDARLEPSLSAQVRAFGEAGFPLVRFCGAPLGEAEQWNELEKALSDAHRNGGWPALSLSGPAELVQHAHDAGFALWEPEPGNGPAAIDEAGWRIGEATARYRLGFESIALRELPAHSRDELWQAQRLRWLVRPPFRRGQGIALIGGSGCGKSTLARLLGKRLGLPVQDLDEIIARQARKPVSRIFAEDGEPVFRALETEATCEAFRSVSVLALGGGAWESAAVRSCAWASGHAVLWLAENPGRIWRRVARDPARPLAQDEAAYLARWRERMPRWMEAPMVLPLGRTANQVASTLIECAPA